MLVKSLILFCVVCCTSGAAIPTPFDPEKIIYEFAFDPNSELFTPISPETVKHVHGISEMDIQSYDVDGQEYKIHNDGGYPIPEDILESSSPTSATEGTYKIGHESTIGYFLYPTSSLASEKHTIKNRLAGFGNAVEERTVYRIAKEAEYYYFYPSPHQYDPDILSTSTAAPSTTEASESTASSQDISTQTSETPTTETVELNTSSQDTSASKPEPDISTPTKMISLTNRTTILFAIIVVLIIVIVIVLACLFSILREYHGIGNSPSSYKITPISV